MKNKDKLKKEYDLKIKEYNKHNELYYDKSDPLISDAEYDFLKKDILQLENKYKFLKNNSSPAKNIGHKPSKSFEKFKHKVPMLSLSNAF